MFIFLSEGPDFFGSDLVISQAKCGLAWGGEVAAGLPALGIGV